MSQAASAERPLVLIGAGKMGGAMLAGWLEGGLDPGAVVLVDPRPPADMLAFITARGLRHAPSAPDGLTAGILVLAVKPQIADDVMRAAASLVDERTLVLSVMAGKTIARMRECLGGGAIVRTIPNTPAQVGRGITGAFAGAEVDAGQRDLAQKLLAAVGRLVWVETEDQIDLVTAVSGSGPAYVFHMVEALAAAGTAAGLPPATAAALARATVEGAGELLYQSPLDPAMLRENVTSPNGTTFAALQVLMRTPGGLSELMTEAVAAAARRSRELAG
jgi:pyrroline-5-carboxylate reductase